MTTHRLARRGVSLAAALLLLTFAGRPASGYIHFPPPTFARLCEYSNNVRVLKVERVDRERGAIDFKVVENLRGTDSWGVGRHLLRPTCAGTKAVLEWAEKGKEVVMFTAEHQIDGKFPNGSGYVFFDGGCYSIDYNVKAGFWLYLRPEPGMTACFDGTAAKLREAAKDVLAGKKVDVPTKAPALKEDKDKRAKEVDDLMKTNRAKR